ncbi:MAG: patatin-like phospholipase family protein [Gemmatimonadetes bacterium]|nr:patatin-like phospholipase family protein [Gemmatimonadota bacterium]
MSTTPDAEGLALVLTGGGARAAYQAGLLSWLARNYPELRIPILTGISAGAMNAASLAQHHGSFPQAVAELVALWSELMPERVFRVDIRWLARNVGRWGAGLLSGGARGDPRVRGLLDTAPLHELLHESLAPVDGELTGIDYNLQRGTLQAVALSATSYTTGQSVVWAQGRRIGGWERPNRRGVQTRLQVDHIMASAALPLLFPAVRVGEEWYGDGGMRQTAPLSPALHLGARKLLAISTRYDRSRAEAERPSITGYPPPAQILGVLYNAIFLDLIDQDVLRLERLNRLVEKLPEEEREGMRVVRLLVLRPSCDLGVLARDYEPRLPRAFRFLTRGLGTRQTRSADLLSLMMFQGDYLQRLVAMGEADAEARAEEIEAFLSV